MAYAAAGAAVMRGAEAVAGARRMAVAYARVTRVVAVAAGSAVVSVAGSVNSLNERSE